MKFNVGDRVVYSFNIRDQTFNHFGVIKNFKKSKYGLCTVFFPKENIEVSILEQSLIPQPTVSREDLL